MPTQSTSTGDADSVSPEDSALIEQMAKLTIQGKSDDSCRAKSGVSTDAKPSSVGRKYNFLKPKASHADIRKRVEARREKQAETEIHVKNDNPKCDHQAEAKSPPAMSNSYFTWYNHRRAKIAKGKMATKPDKTKTHLQDDSTKCDNDDSMDSLNAWLAPPAAGSRPGPRLPNPDNDPWVAGLNAWFEQPSLPQPLVSPAPTQPPQSPPSPQNPRKYGRGVDTVLANPENRDQDQILQDILESRKSKVTTKPKVRLSPVEVGEPKIAKGKMPAKPDETKTQLKDDRTKCDDQNQDKISLETPKYQKPKVRLSPKPSVEVGEPTSAPKKLKSRKSNGGTGEPTSTSKLKSHRRNAEIEKRTSTSKVVSPPPSFLKLPLEIRERIYTSVFEDLPTRLVFDNLTTFCPRALHPGTLPSICFTSKKIWLESVLAYIRRTRLVVKDERESIFNTGKCTLAKWNDWLSTLPEDQGFHAVRMLSFHPTSPSRNMEFLLETVDHDGMPLSVPIISKLSGLRSLILDVAKITLYCDRHSEDGIWRRNDERKFMSISELRGIRGYKELFELRNLRHLRIIFKEQSDHVPLTEDPPVPPTYCAPYGNFVAMLRDGFKQRGGEINIVFEYPRSG